MTIRSADVFKQGKLAATLERTANGNIFAYLEDYLSSGGPPVASTLPLQREPRTTAAGAVPPFFAGLLPEGRRLTALRRTVKTSADDELSLLAAVGSDTIGDVQVIAPGEPPIDSVTLTIDRSFAEIRFADLLTDAGMIATPTLAGVQDKVSAAMISLPLARRHQRFILKLNPPENPYLVQNEAFFLGLAKRSKLATAAFRVVQDSDGEPGLLVTRFDRIDGGSTPIALAVEDACQALDLWPADKYNVSMEEAAYALIRIAGAPIVAARDILRQVIFAWLTGNGDQHAKNLAVVQNAGENRVAPAYDLPSTLFYGDTTMALTVGGRETLSPARLREFARSLGLPEKAIERALAPIILATTGLTDAMKVELPFDTRLLDKVGRQLATRRRAFQ